MDPDTFTAEEPKPVGYVAPEVTDYGKLTDITAGGTAGNFTDAAFPAGTPKGNITIS
jgi:hypothetical protein